MGNYDEIGRHGEQRLAGFSAAAGWHATRVYARTPPDAACSFGRQPCAAGGTGIKSLASDKMDISVLPLITPARLAALSAAHFCFLEINLNLILPASRGSQAFHRLSHSGGPASCK